jgi:fatty acid synthase
MDNMLQMNILSEDTRGLFVPTSLEKLTIDTKKHVTEIQALTVENEEAGECL